MNLDQQIQELIDNAPSDGTTSALMRAIAPVIKSMAGQLKHPEYYIPRTVDGNWLMVTLKSRKQQTVEKNIISAYATLHDAEVGSRIMSNPTIAPLPIPVTHILFHLIALKTVDSIIFFETSKNLQDGTEILPHTLQTKIKTYLQSQQQDNSSIIV
ncbi:MAG: hypothetical protein F6K09_22100 [Merismopedia sp. SIO2A8]|nr:hypothetical protein [Merismopedia sp. SIO2A8]